MADITDTGYTPPANDGTISSFSTILSKFANEVASKPAYQNADPKTQLSVQQGFYQDNVAPYSDAHNAETNAKQFQLAVAPAKLVYTDPDFLNADEDTRKQILANNLTARGQDPNAPVASTATAGQTGVYGNMAPSNNVDVEYSKFLNDPDVIGKLKEAAKGEAGYLPRAALQLVNPSNKDNNQAINDQIQREKQFPEVNAIGDAEILGSGAVAGKIASLGSGIAEEGTTIAQKVKGLFGRSAAQGTVAAASTPIQTQDPTDKTQVLAGKGWAGMLGAGGNVAGEVVPEVANYILQEGAPVVSSKARTQAAYEKGAAVEAAGSSTPTAPVTSDDILKRDIFNLDNYANNNATVGPNKGDELTPAAAKSQALNSATSELTTKNSQMAGKQDLFQKQSDQASADALQGRSSDLGATAKAITTNAQIDQAVRDNQVAAINNSPFLTPRAPANSSTVAASYVPKAVMEANKAKLAAIDAIKPDLQSVSPIQTSELQQAVAGNSKDIVGANALSNSPTVALINKLPDKPMTLYNFTQLKNQLDSEVASGLNSNGVSLSGGDLTALKAARDNVNTLYDQKMAAIQQTNPALAAKVADVNSFISDTNNKLFRSTANDAGALAGTGTNKIQSVLSPIYQAFKAGKNPDFSAVWSQDPSVVVPDLQKALGDQPGFNNALKNAYARRIQELLPTTPTDAAGKATALNSLLSSSDGKKMLQFGEAIDVGNGQTAADVIRQAAKEHTNQAQLVQSLENAPKATDFSNAPFLQNITQNKEPAALVKDLVSKPQTRADMQTQFNNPSYGPAVQKDTQLAVMQHISDLAQQGDHAQIVKLYGSPQGQSVIDSVFSNNPQDKQLVQNMLTPSQKSVNQTDFLGNAKTDNTGQQAAKAGLVGTIRHFFGGSSMELGEDARALTGALAKNYQTQLQALATDPQYAAQVGKDILAKNANLADLRNTYNNVAKPALAAAVQLSAQKDVSKGNTPQSSRLTGRPFTMSTRPAVSSQ